MWWIRWDIEVVLLVAYLLAARKTYEWTINSYVPFLVWNRKREAAVTAAKSPHHKEQLICWKNAAQWAEQARYLHLTAIIYKIHTNRMQQTKGVLLHLSLSFVAGAAICSSLSTRVRTSGRALFIIFFFWFIITHSFRFCIFFAITWFTILIKNIFWSTP